MKPLFSDFANATTAHGYARIANSNTVAKTIFWILTVLAVNGALAYFIYGAIDEYVAQKITTNFKTQNIDF